jgi:leucine-rich repeat protein SHOC2
MPNWMSYSGEGCSLSFHIPPVFQGLVVWVEKSAHILSKGIIIIIRNKSNGRILFKIQRTQIEYILNQSNYYFIRYGSPLSEGWMTYISRSETAMEDYCGDDELELYISSKPSEYYCEDDELELYVSSEPTGMGHYLKPSVQECGVHVIAGKSDSFEESAVGRDTVMPSPPSYHLFPHPLCGLITASTPKQWSDYLFTRLPKYNLSLILGDA